MNFNLDTIKNADRNPVPNVQNTVTELNGFLKDHGSEKALGKWLQGVDEVGPCLHATFKFQDIDNCLKFAKTVYALQEKVDHHANFTITNFLTVDVKLSTHQPVPAITQVDFLFAKYLITLL